jgi:hypothetical protein
MLRLALMMAVMVLGMPQVHSCQTSTGPAVMWDSEIMEARVCPPVRLGDEKIASAAGEQLDQNHWRKLPAIHCQATQYILTFTFGLGDRIGKAE